MSFLLFHVLCDALHIGQYISGHPEKMFVCCTRILYYLVKTVGRKNANVCS